MLDLVPIQEQVIVAVNKVSDFILSEIGKLHHNDVKTKALNSLVTYVDKTSEELLVNALKSIIPEAAFHTEEDTVAVSEGDWQWIIDPLDGTTNFIHQVPVFAISVGLKYKGEIVLGVVKELNRNECFYATKNKGAYLNGKKISVSHTPQLSDSLVATGFPYYDYDRLENYLEVLKVLMTSTRGIRRMGSAAVDLCYTACGRFDMYFEYSLSPWDVAAGALIVKEAGGFVSDFKGGEHWLYGREIVATNATLKEDVLNLLAAHFK